MKILHFVEATGTDEFAFPADNVTAIQVTNNQAIRIWFSNSDGNTNDHRINITGILPVDSAEETADYFAELIAPDSKGGIYSFNEGDVLPVSTGPVLTTIAYTAGA
tara:strand:- start:74 stop:391 length:318 start_codon:yes stop_codon:yes gene_type:complete